MSAPKLAFSVEPSESGKVLYLPIAAEIAGQNSSIKLILGLTITNNEAASVHVSGVTLSFPGSANAPVVMQVPGFDIPAGKSQFWANGIVNNNSNNEVFLPAPAPPKVMVSVSCNNFASPATVTYDLAAYSTTGSPAGFLFPFHQTDFRIGEYIVASAIHWADGGGGTQINAHDIGVQAVDPNTHQWSQILPGTDGKKNEHWRIWGKPVHAVADGTVVIVVDGVPSNTVIGQFPSSVIDGAGNHFFIKHGDVVVLYAHMQPGSLNPALAHVGATVKAGDQLGLAGNSGNSTNPHTHIHAQKTSSSGPLRMLEFRDMWVVPASKINPPDPAGPWVLVKDQGVPKDPVCIWTAASKPAWYPPGWGEIAYFGIQVADYQTLFDHVTSSGYRPVWFAGFQAGGKALVNVIFRPVDSVSWSARHGLSADQYQQEFDAQRKAGRRLLNVNNYIENGNILYAGIWVDTPTPGLQAYHGKSATEHQTLFDQFFKQGFMPINVSVVSQGGNRTYAAFYEKVDTGSLILKSFLTPAEYQQEWNDNNAAGRQLAYLVTYNHSDGPRFSAIFQQKVAGTGGTVGHHGLTAAQMQTNYDQNLGAGLLTRVIAGYEQNGQASYAAAWRKAPAGALAAAGGIG
jgi:murein DD-endopeptidase MepM/ murein hydrolase activator NlpD